MGSLRKSKVQRTKGDKEMDDCTQEHLKGCRNSEVGRKNRIGWVSQDTSW